MQIKETDQPVVRRIKQGLMDRTVWIRVDVTGDRYVGSFSKKKLTDCRFYLDFLCKKKIGETKRNFTGRFYEFQVYK